MLPVFSSEDIMPDDTAAPPPMEMPPSLNGKEPRMIVLKVAVVIMGVLLVAGFALVIGTIVKRASSPAPVVSAVGPGGRFGVSEVHVAPGEKVRGVLMSEDRLAIHIGSDKSEEIVIVSPRTGAELGRIRLRPLVDLAANPEAQTRR
jgi:hypothetical protein